MFNAEILANIGPIDWYQSWVSYGATENITNYKFFLVCELHGVHHLVDQSQANLLIYADNLRQEYIYQKK